MKHLDHSSSFVIEVRRVNCQILFVLQDFINAWSLIQVQDYCIVQVFFWLSECTSTSEN
jgi:hypothetical protein